MRLNTPVVIVKRARLVARRVENGAKNNTQVPRVHGAETEKVIYRFAGYNNNNNNDTVVIVRQLVR